MQTILTLGMIYGVEPSTTCLFKQLFAKYLVKGFLKAFMIPQTNLQSISGDTSQAGNRGRSLDPVVQPVTGFLTGDDTNLVR